MKMREIEQYRKVFGKKPFLAMIPVVFVGVINLARAWHKHDTEEAIAAVVIFFIFGPLVVWGISRAWESIDD